jgi:post-segregation antitoxin (ccd killing protein)
LLPLVKTEARDEARNLRLEGASIREIEQRLGVARSSVSRWVSGIELTPQQLAELERRSGAGALAGAAVNAERARNRRREWQEEGARRARAGGPSYISGCMLYWGEGSKSRSTVELTNSDVALVRVFADFLRQHFDVPDESMRLRCNLFADHATDQSAIERHWLDALRLPRTSLLTSRVNRYSKYSQKKRTNSLPYGTVRLAVHSTRILQTIYGSIQEIGGFERPEWLG